MVEAKQKLEELDAVLNALAHPARRHILLVVWFRGGEMTAGEIAGRFGCTWPTTSRHLKILVAAGLLKVEKRGRTRFYKVDIAKFNSVKEWFQWFDKKPSSARTSKK
ncbi:MAG TPA: metalloregulator ArsR/SmtB family transcription factor [Blastocatellia bacterium]|nr:metalloregulator ArsR/SmtB family transcription factor [Blastocatellia bacterium]